MKHSIESHLLYAGGFWHLYAIVCPIPFMEGQFVVKVGVSMTPHDRYIRLMPGIPFDSTMICAYAGGRPMAYSIEARVHQRFKERRTRGEWFLFGLESKAEFHDGIRSAYEDSIRKPLKWHEITFEAAKAYVEGMKKPRQPSAFKVA